MNAKVKKKKRKVKTYYLDLRKKYKNIFCEKFSYTQEDIDYYFSQFFFYINKFKKKKFRLVINPIEDPILDTQVKLVVSRGGCPKNLTIKYRE